MSLFNFLGRYVFFGMWSVCQNYIYTGLRSDQTTVRCAQPNLITYSVQSHVYIHVTLTCVFPYPQWFILTVRICIFNFSLKWAHCNQPNQLKIRVWNEPSIFECPLKGLCFVASLEKTQWPQGTNVVDVVFFLSPEWIWSKLKGLLHLSLTQHCCNGNKKHTCGFTCVGAIYEILVGALCDCK